MVRKLLNPRKFWHQGCWGLEHFFGHQNYFNVVGQHIDRDVGGPLRRNLDKTLLYLASVVLRV